MTKEDNGLDDLKKAVMEGDVQKAQAIAIERQRAAIREEGTPSSMREAIMRALCIGPASGVQERLELAMRDYLAQRFGVAMLRTTTPAEQELIKELWNRITGETMK